MKIFVKNDQIEATHSNEQEITYEGCNVYIKYVCKLK